MASRVSSASGRSAVLWLIGSSIAMGFGIWSMHFIGMLAFSLPIELGYDVPLTLLSLVIAIACSAFALYLVCQDTLPWGRLLSGGLLMGLGVASMHYIGMEALLMHPYIFYVPWLVGLSIVIAIVAATAALWLAFRLREKASAPPSAALARPWLWGAPLSACTIPEWRPPNSRSTAFAARPTAGSIQSGWLCWSSLSALRCSPLL